MDSWGFISYGSRSVASFEQALLTSAEGSKTLKVLPICVLNKSVIFAPTPHHQKNKLGHFCIFPKPRNNSFRN